MAAGSPYSLTFTGTVWVLPVAPESLEVRLPARITTTPTLDSAYTDHFGRDVGTIAITATTGWGVGNRARIGNGRDSMRRLLSLYQRFLEVTKASTNPDSKQMLFSDAWAGNVYQVVPARGGLTKTQSKGRPLLQSYSLNLTIIADLTGGKLAGASTDLTAAATLAGQTYRATAEAALDAAVLLGDARRYTVQSGDTLDSIASLFGVDGQVLRDANAIRFAGRVQTGLVITIPGQ